MDRMQTTNSINSAQVFDYDFIALLLSYRKIVLVLVRQSQASRWVLKKKN